MDSQHRSETKLVRTDDIKRLLEVKDYNKSRSRRDSMGSDMSDTDISSKSMPQYSSYRTLSGGLFGPFENPPTRPGSRGGFLPWSSTKSGSKLRTPGSKLKEPVRTRGDGEGSSRPPSRGNNKNSPPRPMFSRENSQSRLPVFKRESSMPQIIRDGHSNVPFMRREKSEIILPPSAKKTPVAHRGSHKPIITQTTPKTVNERKVADRNIAGKGTRSGVSGISDKITIGDKVLITASNKVGMVQYVGETKFAKGIWAGVVLEDSSGKNDGSVSGVRYFTCPALRGVFVKEDKLEKLSGIDSPIKNSVVDLPLSPTSKTPTPVNRNKSTLSIDSGVDEEDLNVGDLVYITSANITRSGILRYVGLTEFAKGTWCGVELQEATGKNDGSVAGSRYFQCKPKYGIFAQIQKVKKYRQGSDSSFGPLSPPILKEECAELPSTKTSTEEIISVCVPDIVNPVKAPVTSSPLTNGSTHYDDDNSIRLHSMVMALQKEKSTLESQVRESKHKIEDLQFQLEEQKMISDEISKQSSPIRTEEEMSLNILEAVLQDEMITSEKIPETKCLNGSAHADEYNSIHLKNLVNSLQKEKSALENEINELKHKVEDLQFQLEEQMLVSDEMAKKSVNDEKVVLLENELSTQLGKITDMQSEIDTLNTQHENDMFLLSEKDAQLETKDETIFKLEQGNTNEVKESIDSNALDIKDEEIKKLKERINFMDKQNEEMKGELEKKLSEKESSVFDLEEKVMDFENKIQSLTIKIDEKETSIDNLKQCVDKKTDELDEINLKLDECNQVIREMKVSAEVLESRNKQVNERNTKLEEDIINTSKNSGDSAQLLTHLNEQLRSRNKEISSLNNEKNILTAENNSLLKQVDDDKINLESTKKELNEIISELDALKLKDTELKTNYDNITEANKNLSGKIIVLENDKVHLTECVRTMEAEKDRLSLEKDSIQSSVESSFKEKTDLLYEEKGKLEKENIMLKVENKDLKDDYKSLTDEVQESKSILQKHKDENSLAQKESSIVIDNLNEELVITQNKLKEIEDKYQTWEREKLKLDEEKDKFLQREKSLEDKVVKIEADMTVENTKLKNQLKETIDRNVSNISKKDAECSNLQFQVRELNSRITLFENNNSLLQFEVDELKQKNIVPMAGTNKRHSKNPLLISDYENLKEELENSKFVNVEKEKEVEFLNSIIVDLQKKNREQKDKINILSFGDDAHELNGHKDLNETTSPAKPNLPMRKFCDICDHFDLHDTEDCPQQCNDAGGSQHNGKRGEKRPYCVICETFGHVAENCDEEEMF